MQQESECWNAGTAFAPNAFALELGRLSPYRGTAFVRSGAELRAIVLAIWQPLLGVPALSKNSLTPFEGFKEAWRQRRVDVTRTERRAMPLYEHIYLARQDVSAGQVEELTNTYAELLGTNGGKVTKSEYWGLKSLSDRINKNRKAHYSLLNIDAPHAAVAEMERQMRINEDVLRFMTIRVDEHEDGPSAMMQKRDERSDRGDRGDRGDRPRGPRRF
jgi:small subunit ribosomal protein S6